MSVWIDAVCIDQHNYVERAAQVNIMSQIFNQAGEVRIWLGETDATIKDGSSQERNWFRSLQCQDRPWWRRLWVVQECAYAKECPIVMFGTRSMKLDEFLHRWYSSGAADDGKGGLTYDFRCCRFPYDAWSQQSKENRHRFPLLQRIRETRGRECALPHDRVYALLGLINEDDARQLLPDYRRPYLELVLTVKVMLRNTDCSEDELFNDLCSDP